MLGFGASILPPLTAASRRTSQGAGAGAGAEPAVPMPNTPRRTSLVPVYRRARLDSIFSARIAPRGRAATTAPDDMAEALRRLREAHEARAAAAKEARAGTQTSIPEAAGSDSGSGSDSGGDNGSGNGGGSPSRGGRVEAARLVVAAPDEPEVGASGAAAAGVQELTVGGGDGDGGGAGSGDEGDVTAQVDVWMNKGASHIGGSQVDDAAAAGTGTTASGFGIVPGSGAAGSGDTADTHAVEPLLDESALSTCQQLRILASYKVFVWVTLGLSALYFVVTGIQFWVTDCTTRAHCSLLLLPV